MEIKRMKSLKFVNILTNWKSVVWGMDGRFCFVPALLAFVTLVLSTNVLGGPTQPATKDLTASQQALSGHSSGLEERSPEVLDIVVRMGDPFIEVYLKAAGPLECFDIREYSVKRQEDKTIIIPILRRSKPLTPCEPTRKTFEDKVADLDPNLDSAYLLEVLGFRGWHKRELVRP